LARRLSSAGHRRALRFPQVASRVRHPSVLSYQGNRMSTFSRSFRRRALSCAIVAALPLAFIAQAQAASITGRVVDGQGRHGFQGASGRVLETGREVVTGDDGLLNLAGLAAGDSPLEIRYVGAAPVQRTIQVSEPGIAVADIVLASAVGGATDFDRILVVGQ